MLFAVGIYWGAIALRNGYYSYSISKQRNKIISLNDSLYKLPTDYILRLYNKVKKTFVNKYSVGDKIFIVAVSDVPEFSSKYKNAILMPVDPVGYVSLNKSRHISFWSKWDDLGKNAQSIVSGDVPESVKALFDDNKHLGADPETIYQLDHSQLAYYDIPYSDFKSRISGMPFDYEYHSPVRVDLDSMRNSIGYSDETKLQKEKIEEQINYCQQKIYSAYSKIISGWEIGADIIIWACILFAIAYPVRFIFLSIRWALKTVRQ